MKKWQVCSLVIGSVLAVVFLIVACGGGGGGGGKSLEPFNTSCFPLDIPNSVGGWGNIAFDGDGNLLIPNNGTDEILSVDRLTCTMSTLATIPAVGPPLSIVYNPDMDTIYLGDDLGNIFAVNPSSGASTLLVNVGAYVNVLVVAPEGYGTLGGQLLAGTNNGIITAVDTASAATTEVADLGLPLSDMEFAEDGTLYAVIDAPGEILTIAANGMASVFATGFLELDGIAVDDAGGRLLVSDSDGDTLYAVRLLDGTRMIHDTYDFDSGWYPSGLAFDGFETLLIATGEDNLTIQAVTLWTELLTNGGFETGDLTGWTAESLDGPAAAGSIIVIDALNAPASSLTLAGPSGGSWYAISDQMDPSTDVLVQEFTMPAEDSEIELSFDMFVLDNSGLGPINAGVLDHNGATNQHARVDILSATAGNFDVGGGVILNLYLDVDGYVPVVPYTTYHVDLSGDLTPGETYKVRFAQTDNLFFLHMGVDNVSVWSR